MLLSHCSTKTRNRLWPTLLHRRTSSTNFVKWQTSATVCRLVFIADRRPHSTCLLSATEPFQLSNFTRRAPLAGRSREDWIQARCDGVPVSAWTPCYLADHLPASDTAPRRSRVYDLPTGTVSMCLAVDSARTAVGLSTMPARQSGTRCLMNLEILTVLIGLNGSGKQFSLAATSGSSALEVIFIMRCAI